MARELELLVAVALGATAALLAGRASLAFSRSMFENWKASAEREAEKARATETERYESHRELLRNLGQSAIEESRDSRAMLMEWMSRANEQHSERLASMAAEHRRAIESLETKGAVAESAKAIRDLSDKVDLMAGSLTQLTVITAKTNRTHLERTRQVGEGAPGEPGTVPVRKPPADPELVKLEAGLVDPPTKAPSAAEQVRARAFAEPT